MNSSGPSRGGEGEKSGRSAEAGGGSIRLDGAGARAAPSSAGDVRKSRAGADLSLSTRQQESLSEIDVDDELPE